MSSGRGGNNRRKSSRRRERDNDRWQDNSQRGEKKAGDPSRGGEPRRFGEAPRVDKNRGGFFERPRWTPPKPPAEPIPMPDCPYCGKPIKDISSAISDINSGEPVHFDCVINRISEAEVLERGDAVTYIGGGRFGVVHFNRSPESPKKPENAQNFKIKKILEWENKENRADWRKSVSDHYSAT